VTILVRKVPSHQGEEHSTRRPASTAIGNLHPAPGLDLFRFLQELEGFLRTQAIGHKPELL
jgi:hypothetical protein